MGLGRNLAAALQAGLAIWLHGDLGAGKTTLVRGLLKGMGHAGKVKSPTYTLVEPYVISGLHLYHFDLYRFVDPEEWDASGFRDYFNPDSICLVEWPEKAADLMPMPDITVTLRPDGDGRLATLDARSEMGKQCLNRLSR